MAIGKSKTAGTAMQTGWKIDQIGGTNGRNRGNGKAAIINRARIFIHDDPGIGGAGPGERCGFAVSQISRLITVVVGAEEPATAHRSTNGAWISAASGR